jgi:hypothetical protein
MGAKWLRGELGLALVFAAVGALWMVKGAGLPLWDGFAPDTGFLPLIYGCLLAALSAVVFVQVLVAARKGESAPPEIIGKPLAVAAALAVAVAALPYAGFALAVFLLLLFLYAVVERLPWLPSILAAGGTTAVLYLIFKTWLRVPLPGFFE